VLLLAAGAVGGVVAIVAGIVIAAAAPSPGPLAVAASATSQPAPDPGHSSGLCHAAGVLSRRTFPRPEPARAGALRQRGLQPVSHAGQYPQSHADRFGHDHRDADSHRDGSLIC
jgi:hypothetical protein